MHEPGTINKLQPVSSHYKLKQAKFCSCRKLYHHLTNNKSSVGWAFLLKTILIADPDREDLQSYCHLYHTHHNARPIKIVYKNYFYTY